MSSNIATVHGQARHLLLGECVVQHTRAIQWHVTTCLPPSGLPLMVKVLHLTCSKFYRGFPPIEKYGMLVGGIDPHLFDLSTVACTCSKRITSGPQEISRLVSILAIFPSYEVPGHERSPQRMRCWWLFNPFGRHKCATKRRLTKSSRRG